MASSLSDLIQLLAQPGPVPPLVDLGVGVSMPSTGLDGFVEPPVKLDADVPAGILLVAAPAAVGKTTTALEIAARTGAPLWDLSRTQVGSNGFVGGLARAFGPATLPSVLEGLQSGKGLIVLDALDEAHLRSGHLNLEAFLTDLAHAVGATTQRITVVALARVETAELARIALELGGAHVRVALLDYFDETSARHFIDTRLAIERRRNGRTLVHRANAAAFRSAVDGIFSFIYACFPTSSGREWDTDAVRAFLGYAPVLEAIAGYLDVDNLQTAVNEVAEAVGYGPASLSGPWRFLVGVVDAIMERERAKVLSAVEEPMADVAEDHGWGEWETLYLPDEQIDRVLRRHFRSDLFSDRTPLMPQRVRDVYEERLEPVADQHPFLSDRRTFSNTVFREYAFAWALTRGTGTIQASVTDQLTAGAFLASPLLGRFLVALAPVGPAGPTVSPDHLGLLFDSLSAAAKRSGDVLLWVVSSDDSGTYGRISSFAQNDDDVEFSLGDGSRPVRFWRRLANADILVAGGVILGHPGRPFTLGPYVDLETDILETPAAEYTVTGEEDGSVRLISEVHVDSPTPPQLKVFERGSLHVSWEPLTHPWYPYAVDVSYEGVPPELAAAFADLVSIVRRFRKHGRDEWAKKKELIDNVVVGRYVSDRTAGARRLLAYLLERGVLSEARGLYVLHLAPLGMTWTDVVSRQMTPAARQFLEQYLEANEIVV